jgi:hypothetical protein
MPSNASCSNYMYPDALAKQDIETNCQAMPFMTACNVWQACKSGAVSGAICNPFNILASTCLDEGMHKMPGCAVYTPMCLESADSVVKQCDGAGITRLVHTMATQV